MEEIVLTVNVGSSSIKYSGIKYNDPTQSVFESTVESLTVQDIYTEVHTYFLNFEKNYPDKKLMACAHRIVMGGSIYTESVRIDAKVMANLDRLSSLAPLHMPPEIMAIKAIVEVMPSLPQIACFDTAFHQTRPDVDKQYPIPMQYFTKYHISRYGFHGLSYAYIANKMHAINSVAANSRLVIAHIGNGASACALKDGISQATTMGFTPLEGMMMGTRSGSVDPALVLYWLQQGKTAEEVSTILLKESGLLGVSGISSDMRTVLNAAKNNNKQAKDALELFYYRTAQEITRLIPAIGGIDTLVFTAGIGEHDAIMRARVCQYLAWLGIEIEEEANKAHFKVITTYNSSVKVWVLPTNEAEMMAQYTKELLSLY